MKLPEKKVLLLDALIEHKGLQYITDLGEKILGNPLFIYDMSGKILAKSSSDEARALWMELLPDSSLNAENLYVTEQQGIIEKIIAQDEPVLGKFHYSPYRFSGCRIRDKDGAVGISTIVELHPIKDEDGDLLVFISKTILFELLYRERTAMQIIPYYGLLKDIIEDNEEESSVLERCNILRLHIPERMVLLGLKFSERRKNTLSLFYIRENLMSIIPSSLCIIYDFSLIVVLDEKHMGKSLISQITRAFSNYEMRIGASRAFHGIMNLKNAFQEMKAIQSVYVKLGIDRSLIYYDDIVLYHFMELASKEHDVNEFYYPAVRLLQEYDCDNHVNLCESVEAYLESGRNIQKAANHLHMHKNTLYYRLKRAEQVADIDLNDENTCFNLQFSLRMNRMSQR